MSVLHKPVKRKKKPGRPPLPEGREKFTTTLPPGYLERLRTIGRGNASAGIVWLVDEHLKDHPAVRLRG